MEFIQATARYELVEILEKVGIPTLLANHYYFYVSKDYAYVWPCEEVGKFKTVIGGVSKEWNYGDSMPLDR